MVNLYYPTIDLYLYDLINGLGYSSDQTEEKRQNFIQKFPANLQKKPLKFPQQESDFYLLSSEYISKEVAINDRELAYLPVLLGDSGGLQIDYSVKDKIPSSPDIFRQLRKELIDQHQGIEGSLGQTYLISAYLSPEQSPENKEAILAIAQQCYKDFIPNANWGEDYDGEGNFFGGQVFELSANQGLSRCYHVLIILYPNYKAMFDGNSQLSLDWMRLFYYYHKILWSYNQGVFIKKQLKDTFGTIQKISSSTLSSANDNLSQKTQVLTITERVLNDFLLDLPVLQLQSNTLEINLENYNKRTKTIVEKAQKASSPADLSFLANFSRRATDKYLLQLRKDRENFELSLRVLENRINTVRTNLDIEKAERERNFQKIVTIIGGGVAVTSTLDKQSGLCKALFPPSSKSINPKAQLLIVNPNPNSTSIASSFHVDCNDPRQGIILFPVFLIVSFGMLALFFKWILSKDSILFLKWAWSKTNKKSDNSKSD